MATPRIVFGSMTFGKQVKAAQATEMLAYFYDKITGERVEIDTASMYGKKNGQTERILGNIMTPEQKSRLYIATKVNPSWEGGLTGDGLTKQFMSSLERLQLPSVDLLYLHRPDHDTPIIDTLAAVQKLFEDGKFKALGLSNYAAWQVAEIYYLCKQRNWVLPTVYQGMYNAFTRQVELELFPCLRRFDIKFYAFNPLAGGLLTGKYNASDDKPVKGTRFDRNRMYQSRYWMDSYFKAVNQLRTVLDEYNKDKDQKITMAEAAVRWCQYHSKMDGDKEDAIIIGQSSMDHLKLNMTACIAGPLPEEIVNVFNQGWETCKADVPKYFR